MIISSTFFFTASRLKDAGSCMPLYTFATPVFGGQLTMGAIGLYGRAESLTGSVTGTLATPLGTLPFSRFDSISDSVTGFGDVLPIATLRWNNGVHNYMKRPYAKRFLGSFECQNFLQGGQNIWEICTLSQQGHCVA